MERLYLATASSREAMVMSGYLEVPGGRVWYRTLGGGRAYPLIVVHGGPGGAHDYLEPLSALADERQIVFYDQLGSGRSDRPSDTQLCLIREPRSTIEVGHLRA